MLVLLFIDQDSFYVVVKRFYYKKTNSLTLFINRKNIIPFQAFSIRYPKLYHQ